MAWNNKLTCSNNTKLFEVQSYSFTKCNKDAINCKNK